MPRLRSKIADSVGLNRMPAGFTKEPSQLHSSKSSIGQLSWFRPYERNPRNERQGRGPNGQTASQSSGFAIPCLA